MPYQRAKFDIFSLVFNRVSASFVFKYNDFHVQKISNFLGEN